ncbi:hypothetical protein WN51_01255 [Melipona quadrifasciata]|uniref:Uncharacterized protein n=1 Tax=Melipona quadrifasciata TaxID=166423 RepID=A0A0M8ZWR7_9HYME|nr:hypothetical protein WN51_01255 [Melipona quadrifasciata]
MSATKRSPTTNRHSARNTEKRRGDNKGDEANLERMQRTPEDEEDATRVRKCIPALSSINHKIPVYSHSIQRVPKIHSYVYDLESVGSIEFYEAVTFVCKLHVRALVYGIIETLVFEVLLADLYS